MFDWFKKKSSKEEYDKAVKRNEKTIQQIYLTLHQLKQNAEKLNLHEEYNNCEITFNEIVELQNQIHDEVAEIENTMDIHQKKLEDILSNKKPLEKRYIHQLDLLQTSIDNKLKESK